MKKFAIFSTVMIIGAGIALAQTLNVPFYRDGDDGALNTQGFIGVKNTTGGDVTMTITYTSLGASNSSFPKGQPTNLVVTHVIAANTGVSWRPVANLGAEGPLGRAVPDNTTVGPDGANVSIVGSASVEGAGLEGRYVEQNITAGSAFGHAL